MASNNPPDASPVGPKTQGSRDSLGDRMKGYERIFRSRLVPRTPVLLRLDGVAFHTFCRDLVRPFDNGLIDVLDRATVDLCERIGGAQLAYVQSDEISVLIHSYKRLDSQAWFNNDVQKITTVTAAMVSSFVSQVYQRPAYFDCRAWVLPEAEVANYFIWRQQDASRNSLSMLARSLYTHDECDGKSGPQLQEMCWAKGQNWNNLPTRLRRGRCVVRRSQEQNGVTRSQWVVDDDIPIFTADRNYIERHLVVEED